MNAARAPGPLPALAGRRAAQFPALDAAWIVHEDDDLIAVDKPDGVPSQAADPEHPDDLVLRLKRFLAARDGVTDPYLGIHQRLDQDTSGVLLYAKSRRANSGLARQLEGRTVDKRYLALVDRWRGPDRRLEHHLVRRGGATIVADRPGGRGSARAKRAVTEVRVVERRGSRALLELRIETGRTHQIRAQLAAEGAAVVGDRLYGGSAAPRLMLHSASLSLRHPVDGRPLTLRAPAPRAFFERLAGRGPSGAEAELNEALARAMQRRWGLAHRAADPAPTSAFRLVNRGGDGLPGLAVDVYDDWLVAHVYDEATQGRLDAVLDALHALGFSGVYVKRRPRQANVIVDGRDEELSPSHPLRGQAAPEALVVHEGGLPFAVRLGEGLSTGVFLDQRDNRRRVRELAAGARVLNLFAYTCGFTLAAAAGGARRTVSVDASARLLAWGRENLEAAGLGGPSASFVQADVFDTLEDLRQRGERFDLVCVDPPTYSRTRSSRWTSGGDWERLGAACLSVLAPGGTVLACSNDQRMSGQRFRRHLHRAARAAGVELAQMKDLPCPSDFPPPPGEEPHLKTLLCRAGARAADPPRRPRRRGGRSRR